MAPTGITKVYVIEVNKGNGHTGVFLKANPTKRILTTKQLKTATLFANEESAKSVYSTLGFTKKDYVISAFNNDGDLWARV